MVQALRPKRNERAKCKLPPGPTPLPIIGNILQLGEQPHKSLATLAAIHGPIMSLKLGLMTTIIVSSAEIAKQVLQTHDHLLSNRTIPHAITGQNHHEFSLPFMPTTPRWRFLRKICNNLLFSSKILDTTQKRRSWKVQELLTRIHQSSLTGEAIEIGRSTFMTVVNMLSNSVCSLDLVHADTVNEFKELESDVMKEVGRPNVADYFPILKMVDPLGIKRRMHVYFGKVLKIIHDLVDHRLQLRQETSNVTDNDMLDGLLRISEDDTRQLNTTMIERLLMDLFLAGSDTTTSTLEWAMTELIRNPEAMSKAKAELELTVGKGNPVEENDMDRLPYLLAVLKETFRLHPVVPLLLPRRAEEDVELCGYVIPKGAQVLVNIWAIGRDPSIWNEPDVFNAERFLGSEIDVKGRHFELAPFGAGRRICPGLPLAMKMLVLILGSLINSFDWELEDGMTPEDKDMEDKFGIVMEKAKPLRAVPVRLSK
ncbi:geraniol 8-hydroxylase-like [Prosopis cineraria]|uniref:geraniol 8-hydroxylase-like n=1 Tax=Prosopis cineraria TaxID=364024 RepID=UPI00240ECBD4|nr:geraniol 8-hydroxylase-like [Prosopis cineraria]